MTGGVGGVSDPAGAWHPEEQATQERLQAIMEEASSIGRADPKSIKAPSFLLQVGPPTPLIRDMALTLQGMEEALRKFGERLRENDVADILLSKSVTDFILQHMSEYDLAARTDEYNRQVAIIDELNVSAAENNLQVQQQRAENREYNETVAEPHNAAVDQCIASGNPSCPEYLDLRDENVGTIVSEEPLPELAVYLDDLRELASSFFQFIVLTNEARLDTDEVFRILEDTLFAHFEKVKGNVTEESKVTAPEESAPAQEAGVGALTGISGNLGPTQETNELVQFVIYNIAIQDYLVRSGQQTLDEGAEGLREELSNAKKLLAASGIGSFLNNALDGNIPTSLEDLQESVRLLLNPDVAQALKEQLRSGRIEKGEGILSPPVKPLPLGAVDQAPVPVPAPVEQSQSAERAGQSPAERREVENRSVEARNEPSAAAQTFDPVRDEVISLAIRSQNLSSGLRLESILRDVLNQSLDAAFIAAPLIVLESVMRDEKVREVNLEEQARATAAVAIANNLIGLVQGNENFDRLTSGSFAPLVSSIEDEALRAATLEALENTARFSLLQVADLLLTGAGRNVDGTIANTDVVAVETQLADVTAEVRGKLERANLETIVESFSTAMKEVVSMDAWLTQALDPAVALVLADSMFRSDGADPASSFPRDRPIDGPAV